MHENVSILALFAWQGSFVFCSKCSVVSCDVSYLRQESGEMELLAPGWFRFLPASRSRRLFSKSISLTCFASQPAFLFCLCSSCASFVRTTYDRVQVVLKTCCSYRVGYRFEPWPVDETAKPGEGGVMLPAAATFYFVVMAYLDFSFTRPAPRAAGGLCVPRGVVGGG